MSARSNPLPPDLLARLRQRVERDGEDVVRRACGMSRNAFTRALAGLGVYAGTIALAERGAPVESAAQPSRPPEAA